MYETSIKTWLASIAVAATAGIGLMTAAGSTLHETRIVAGLDRTPVTALNTVVIDGQSLAAHRKVVQACPTGPSAL